ncbi:Uncharacterized protein QTN25_001625 [Entamoeba marina]
MQIVLTSFFFISSVVSLNCIVNETLSLSFGVNSFIFNSVDGPSFIFNPEYDGDYMYWKQTNQLYLSITSKEDINTTLCITSKGTDIKRLSVDYFSMNYLYRTIMPFIPLYQVFGIIFLCIIFIGMLLYALRSLTEFFTDRFCNKSKYVSQYYLENYGILNDDVNSVLSDKGVIIE